MKPGDYKNFAGPISKSKLLDADRQPIFLQRNINSVLNFHCIKSKEAANKSASSVLDHLFSRPIGRTSWKMPSLEQIREAGKKADEVVRIDLKRIQRRGAARGKEDGHGRGGYGFRKKCKIIDVPCTAEIIVSTSKDTDTMYRERRAARLLGHKNSDSDIHFDIELVEGPFLVRVKNLQHLTQRNNKHFYSVPAKFNVAIRLHFKNVEDSSEAISWIDGRTVSANSGNGDWTVLEAQWDKLPECPPENHRLMLRKTDEVKLNNAANGKNVQWVDTRSTLAVNISWRNENTDSPLGWCNKVAKRARFDPLPTPPESIPGSISQSPPRAVRIEWVWKDRKVETQGYRCGVCRRQKFESLDRLRHHLETNHSTNHETYEIESNSRTIKIRIGFEDTNGSKKTKVPSLKPPKPGSMKEELWLEPPEPLDLKRWVRGEKKWTDKGYGVKKGRKSKLGIVKKHHGGPRANPYTHYIPLRRDPREIATQLEEPKKRLYKVPMLQCQEHLTLRKAKTKFVQVPRLKSKKGKKLRVFSTASGKIAAVNAGEELPESDTDADHAYVDAKRSALFEQIITNNPGISETQKAFMISFNEIIDKERISNKVFLSDAIFRFVKTDPDLLKDGAMQGEFEKKLNQLLQDEMIDKTMHDYCVKKSKKLVTGPKAGNRPLSNKCEGIGTSKMKEYTPEAECKIPNQNDNSDPAKTTMGEPVQVGSKILEQKALEREPGKCICGKVVTIMKSAIICANEVNTFLSRFSLKAEKP